MQRRLPNKTHRGPYKINTVEGKRVKLESLSRKPLATTYSISHLKPFKEPPAAASETISKKSIETEIAVGDTEPKPLSKDIGKLDDDVSTSLMTKQ